MLGVMPTLEELRENIVGLTFYFDDLTVTTRVESKAISESALLSMQRSSNVLEIFIRGVGGTN